MRTLGNLLLAMQADGEAAPSHALGGGFIDLIKTSFSTPLSAFVLGTLIIFSIVSWGIILYKLWTFNRVQAQSIRFLEIFRRSTKFSEVQAVCQSLGESPLVGIFLAGYAELNLQLRQAPAAANPATAQAARPVLKSLVSVDRALMRASNVETNKLEKHITECPNCWVIADTTRKTIRIYKGMEPQPIPADIEGRLMQALERKIAAKQRG